MSSLPLSPANQWRQTLDAALAEVPDDWQPTCQAWRRSAEGERLAGALQARQDAGVCMYPAQPFRALMLTRLADVRAVILGQDPYHGPDQAEGLAFSVPAGQKLPPSLRNIFVERSRDLGVPMPLHGHLGDWARAGVLLLNTVLTVEDGRPASHAGWGWEALTDALIVAVAQRTTAVPFLLWGAQAQAKQALIEAAAPGRHGLWLANHPSPLSARRPPRPFVGCGHFGVLQRAGIDLG